MTINTPNRIETIETNAEGFGRKLVQGVHHLEIEVIRVLHGVYGVPSAKPGGPKSAHLEVIGALPNSTVEVEFYSPHGPVAAPASTPTLEPEPADPESDSTPTAEELADKHTRDELVTLAEVQKLEVKSGDNKLDIAQKITEMADGD